MSTDLTFLDCEPCRHRLVERPEYIRTLASIATDTGVTVTAMTVRYFEGFHQRGHREHTEGRAR